MKMHIKIEFDLDFRSDLHLKAIEAYLSELPFEIQYSLPGKLTNYQIEATDVKVAAEA